MGRIGSTVFFISSRLLFRHLFSCIGKKQKKKHSEKKQKTREKKIVRKNRKKRTRKKAKKKHAWKIRFLPSLKVAKIHSRKKISERNMPFLKNGLRKLRKKKTPFIKRAALKKLSKKCTVYKKLGQNSTQEKPLFLIIVWENRLI